MSDAVRSQRRRLTLVIGLMSASIVSILVFSYFSSPPSAESAEANIHITLKSGETLRVAFVGDSITYGLFASKELLGFHRLMAQQWRDSGPVSDYAVGTVNGTAGGALRGNDFPADQQLYVVELGTNDAVRVDYRLFRTQYHDLLDRIYAASPDAKVLCVGVWRPKEVADVFDTVIKDACEARGGVFRKISDLSVNPGLKGPADLPTFAGPSDAFHPNDVGHRLIADRMLQAVSIVREG